MGTKTELRLDKIARMVRQDREISGEELCCRLGVSIATIRRDLDELESRGLLRRNHGGAEVIEPLLYEPFRHDSSFQEQIEQFGDEKRRIAIAAAEMVGDGEVVSFTAGTTTTEVARYLKNRHGLTIVTSTVNLAMEFSQRKDIEVFVTGGYLRGHWFSLVGPAAMDNARRVFPDRMFIGVNGADAAHGLTSKSAEEAELIAVMLGQARKKIAVADHSKIGHFAAYAICPMDAVDILLTDSGADREHVAAIERLGVEVRLV